MREAPRCAALRRHAPHRGSAEKPPNLHPPPPQLACGFMCSHACVVSRLSSPLLLRLLRALCDPAGVPASNIAQTTAPGYRPSVRLLGCRVQCQRCSAGPQKKRAHKARRWNGKHGAWLAVCGGIFDRARFTAGDLVCPLSFSPCRGLCRVFRAEIRPRGACAAASIADQRRAATRPLRAAVLAFHNALLVVAARSFVDVRGVQLGAASRRGGAIGNNGHTMCD